MRGRPDFYRDLIGLPELERYLSLDEFFARHSVATPSQSPGWPEPPPASIGELQARMLLGSSLRLRRMECFMDPAAPVIALLRQLELALQHPKDSLSCYVAPPNAVGLGPHHDETEILTLQITGSKRWRIFHRVDTDQPGMHAREGLDAPTLELTLAPGDLLYLPRGFVHEVTNEAPSFSLTVVFSPFKWSSLLELLTARLAGTSAFMEPLPSGVLHGEARPESLQRAFAERIASIREALAELSLDALCDELAVRHLQRMSPPPDRRFDSLFELDRVTPATLIARRRDVAFRLLRRGEDFTLVLAGGAAVSFGADAEPALQRALAAEGPVPIAELHPSPSEATRLALAYKLVACGLFRVEP